MNFLIGMKSKFFQNTLQNKRFDFKRVVKDLHFIKKRYGSTNYLKRFRSFPLLLNLLFSSKKMINDKKRKGT